MRLTHNRPRRLPLLLTAATILLLSTLIGGSLLRDAAAAPRDHNRDYRGPCFPIARIAIAANARLDAALADLVAGDTLTQDQADAVLARLTEPDPSAQPDNATATATDTTGDHRTRRERAAARAERCATVAANAQDTATAVSNLLGLDWTTITSRLAAGESLAEIAEAEGVSRADLITALQTGTLARLDAAEAAGRITPEERAGREAASLTRIESRIDHHRGDQPNSTESASGATPTT